MHTCMPWKCVSQFPVKIAGFPTQLGLLKASFMADGSLQIHRLVQFLGHDKHSESSIWKLNNLRALERLSRAACKTVCPLLLQSSNTQFSNYHLLPPRRPHTEPKLQIFASFPENYYTYAKSILWYRSNALLRYVQIMYS